MAVLGEVGLSKPTEIQCVDVTSGVLGSHTGSRKMIFYLLPVCCPDNCLRSSLSTASMSSLYCTPPMLFWCSYYFDSWLLASMYLGFIFSSETGLSYRKRKIEILNCSRLHADSLLSRSLATFLAATSVCLAVHNTC